SQTTRLVLEKKLSEESQTTRLVLEKKLAEEEKRINDLFTLQKTQIMEEARHKSIEHNEIRRDILEKTRYYNSSIERVYYEDALGKGYEQVTNFENRFLALIKGLDNKSIETVVHILKRIGQIYSTPGKLDILTIEEQRQLRALDDHFQRDILKISETLFYYNGYFLPINHFEPCVFYYKHGLDLVQTLDSVRDRDIIDAGGFIGDSSLILSPLTNKNVYSFEPSPENFTLLLKTLALNQKENVVAENLALCSENKKISFAISGSCSSSYENKAFKYSDHIEVDAVTLDDYVEKYHLDVGLIKTDLEGAEMDFLKGALKTIKRCKPILLISIYHTIDDFLDIKPMIENLDLGYKFTIFKPIDNSIMIETVLIAEVR
ncbi:MAG: FkbM family methyltransferase, partial [Methanocorpusculum sp.]|nr:FkbM family methyltransferase [Methanocorpusculum sp.]